MKYKKYSYLLALILMLLVGINSVYAAGKDDELKCYYKSDDNNAKIRLTIYWNTGNDGVAGNFFADYAKVSVDKMGEDNFPYHSKELVNWFPFWPFGKECITGDKVCFGYKYSDIWEANEPPVNPTCPQNLVYEDSGGLFGILVWWTDSSIKATEAQTEIRKNGYTGYYLKQTNQQDYYSEFVEQGLIKYEDDEPTCADYELIFGDKNDDGETYDPDGDEQSSIRYMVNHILLYVRIIVPMLIIVLGMLDFGKAVMAGKEDNMKKAQSDFIKRVLMGVAVFFVPLLVDVIMALADIIWAGNYIHCPL